MFWRFTLGVNSMGFDKCLNDMYPQTTSTVLNPSVLYLSLLLSPANPGQPLILLVCVVLPFPKRHIVGIIYIAFVHFVLLGGLSFS